MNISYQKQKPPEKFAADLKSSFKKKPFGYSSKNPSKKTTGFQKEKKKRINWSQVPSLIVRLKIKEEERKRLKRRLQYVFLLRKFNNVIDFTNLKLLKGFVTKFGKIKSRRKTKLPVQYHKRMTKAIKRARCSGILPHSCNVVIKM